MEPYAPADRLVKVPAILPPLGVTVADVMAAVTTMIEAVC